MALRRMALITVALAFMIVGEGCSTPPSSYSTNIAATSSRTPNEPADDFYAGMRDYLDDFFAPPLIEKNAMTTEKIIAKTSARDRYTVEVTYPLVRNLRISTTAVNNLNQELKKTGDQAVEDFVSTTLTWNRENPDDTKSSLEIHFHPYVLTSNLVSILFTYSEYNAGSVRPWHYRKPFVYDITRSVKLAPKDFFLPGSAYLETLSKLALKEAEAEYNKENWPDLSDQFKDFMAPKEESFEDYIVTKDGFLFFFALYSPGPTVIAVPWEAVKGLVDPSGPARYFLK